MMDSLQKLTTLGVKKKLFDWRNIEKKNRVGRSEFFIFFFFKSMFHIPEHKIYDTHTKTNRTNAHLHFFCNTSFICHFECPHIHIIS